MEISAKAPGVFGWVAKRAQFFELVWLLVKRDIKIKYRGSLFGYAWSMLNPLLFMAIVSTVFSYVVRGVENYELYVLSGILFWNLCSVSITLGTNSIVNNASLIKKVKVPIWVFPFVPIGSSLTNFLLALFPYCLFFFARGRAIPEQFYLLPVVVLLTLLFVAGLVLALASLNAFFRDVAHMLEPVMVLCFYATPIIYDRNAAGMSDRVKTLLMFNPFTHFVEGFRAAVFGGASLSWSALAIMLGLAVMSLAIGALSYKKSKNKFIYVI